MNWQKKTVLPQESTAELMRASADKILAHFYQGIKEKNLKITKEPVIEIHIKAEFL